MLGQKLVELIMYVLKGVVSTWWDQVQNNESLAARKRADENMGEIEAIIKGQIFAT